MSNPVAEAVKETVGTPKQIASWAKAKPYVFGLTVFLIVVLAIRYRSAIAKFLTGINFLGIGKAMGKILAVTAAVLFVFGVGGDAQAATAAHHVASGGGHFLAWLLGLLSSSGIAMGSVFFPKEDTLDLRTLDGDFTVAMTPGTAEVQKQFKVTASKGSFAGSWIKGTGITLRLETTFDQAASGGSAVNWDDLFRISSGLELVHPLWGTILTKETGAGPILKHIIEFVGHGYHYAGDSARAQIPSTDGDTTVELYMTYPIAVRNLRRPHDMACWIGWLDQTLINFTLNTAATIAAVSTGAVIKTPTNLQVGLDYILDGQLEVPTLSFFHRYEHNAASNTIRLLGMGSFGPKATKKVERILGLFELMNVSGLGGATTSDNITQVFLEQAGMDRVVNIDFIIKNYLKMIGESRGPKGGLASGTVPHALSGNPYTQAATPNGKLNDANLMYVPIRAAGLQQEITKAWKFAGDMVITQTYTTTPTTGTHKVVAQTVREFEPAMVAELQARANRAGAPADIPLADGQSVQQAAARLGGVRPLHGLPRRA